MTNAGCGRERDVAAAVRVSRLEGELERHAASCAVCREVATVAGFLGELARQPLESRPLAAADLYRRARLLERLFREPAPIASTLERLALAEVVGVLVSAAALLTWLLGVGSDWAARLPLGTLSLLPWLAPSQLALAALVGLSVVAALPMIAMWPLLAAED